VLKHAEIMVSVEFSFDFKRQTLICQKTENCPVILSAFAILTSFRQSTQVPIFML